MATASMPRVGDDIKLGPEPQVFAVRFLEGKAVASRFPGGRNMFSTPDGGKLFLNDEDTSEFEHAMIEAGVRAGEQMSVSRVSHGRGGGFSIRVRRIQSDTEELLRRSVAIAQQSRRAEAASCQATSPVHQSPNQEPVQGTQQPNGNAGLSPASAKLCSTMCVLIDSMTEAKSYAQRRGIDLTNEDLRCLVTTAYISECKGGR